MQDKATVIKSLGMQGKAAVNKIQTKQDVKKPSGTDTSSATTLNVDNSDLVSASGAIPIREEEFQIPKDHIRRQHCREGNNIVHGILVKVNNRMLEVHLNPVVFYLSTE